MIRIALGNDWIKKDPFFGIQFKHETVEFLTNDELQRIIAKDFQIERLSQVRDVFVFCCFTGLAYIDVKNLTTNHIQTGFDGGLWIMTKRQKPIRK